jgi:hypothetical protein
VRQRALVSPLVLAANGPIMSGVDVWKDTLITYFELQKWKYSELPLQVSELVYLVCLELEENLILQYLFCLFVRWFLRVYISISYRK